jgi:hypothetical protein
VNIDLRSAIAEITTLFARRTRHRASSDAVASPSAHFLFQSGRRNSYLTSFAHDADEGDGLFSDDAFLVEWGDRYPTLRRATAASRPV